jgi:hypothetical protein
MGMETFLKFVSEFPNKKMVWSSKEKVVCKIAKPMSVMYASF